MDPLKFLTKPKKVEDVSNEPKTVDDIFEEQIKTGLAEHQRSSRGLFFSAFSAGLEIGFTLFLAGIILTLYNGILHPSAVHFLLAIAYPIGFIFVVIGRSELFTEHTALAVIPVLNGSASFKSLLKVWSVIFVGNLVGGYVIAMVLAVFGPEMKIISQPAFHSLATKLTDHSWSIMLGSSILAGWLMGLLSWLVTSSQETMSRIFMVFLITSLIGLGTLHHSIVGSIEVFADVILGGTSFTQYLKFQWWTTIGNIIGGTIFVSLIKYCVIRFSRKDEENVV
ncbi:MAG: formate/nitrite transporter family protein [Fulvivirga sp.]|nr:formate/nitrite transporter family protein [Fulvivirga sp.]